jgi:hypothetical protein
MKNWFKKLVTVLKHELANRRQLVDIGEYELTPIQPKSLNPNATGQTVVPVIMCCWSRIELLANTLRDLNNQKGVCVQLHLWNNNDNALKQIIDTIESIEFHSPIMLYRSKNNIGGFGRFFAGKSLANEFKYAITVDDDQAFYDNFVIDMYNEGKPKTILGNFAFLFKEGSHYWEKELAEPGQHVDYCGTGGAIFDTSIFTVDGVYDCKKRYWFVEDLWICAVARKLGWEIKRSKTKFKFLEQDGKDQHKKMHLLKIYFLEYLRSTQYF